MNVSVQEMREHIRRGAAHPIVDVTAWGDSLGHGFALGGGLPTDRTKDGAGADWLRQAMPRGVSGRIVASIGANIDDDAQTLALAQEAIRQNPGAQFTFLIPANRPQLAQSLAQFGAVKPVTPSASDPMHLHPDMKGYRALAGEVLGGGQQARDPRHEAAQLAVGVGQQLGVNPADVLTAIGYETGGSYDQWQRGPTTKWGQHRGRIQWGEPQRRKYGVYQGMPLDQEIAATAAYLRDTGVRPGMGLEDIYSAINAGSVGKPNASDRPGMTVRSHVAGMGNFRREADQLLAYAGATQTSDPTALAINRSPRLPVPAPASNPYRLPIAGPAPAPLGSSGPMSLSAPFGNLGDPVPMKDTAQDILTAAMKPPAGPLAMPQIGFNAPRAPVSASPVSYSPPHLPMSPAPRARPGMRMERGFGPFQGPGPVTGPYSILNDYTPASMFMFGTQNVGPRVPQMGGGFFSRLFGG